MPSDPIPYRVTNPHRVGTVCLVARRSITPGTTHEHDYNFRLSRVVEGSRYGIVEVTEGLAAGGFAQAEQQPDRPYRTYALPRGFRQRDAWEAFGTKAWRTRVAAQVALAPYHAKERE